MGRRGIGGTGRLTGVSDASGTLSFQYDLRGRVLQNTRVAPVTGTLLITSYTYDAVGQLATMTYPTGHVVSYTWELGRLSGMSIGGQPILSVVSQFEITRNWAY